MTFLETASAMQPSHRGRPRVWLAGARSAVLALTTLAGSATASPQLLDIHGNGQQVPVLRHEDGTWHAYAGPGIGTAIRLAMARKPEWR